MSRNEMTYAIEKSQNLSPSIAIYLGNRKTFALQMGIMLSVLLLMLTVSGSIFAQTVNYNNQYQTSKASAFRQEIARMVVTVERPGETPLPISMVPRVQTGDVIRIRMLDEPINGVSPDESNWDWTLLVAFINPSRNETEQESVSREIQFRRDGWYREHMFKVPYDSQPVFFLYPKPKYRNKIKKLLSKNFSEIQKIGEKTLEIADAYGQIGLFLNELQGIINQNPYGYGSYSGYNSPFGSNNYGNGGRFGENFTQTQVVERLAQSFNIALPNCWTGNNSSYGQYNSYNTANSNDFISRAQCVAKNVSLEDFDLSVSRVLRQGGLLVAAKLIEKYPQLEYWINIAAAAADIIIKILQRTPMKVVPTMAQTGSNNQYGYSSFNSNSLYNSGNSYSSSGQNVQGLPPMEKISLYAETPPTNSDFVTAFPIVLHKWQPEADPEVIALPVPSLFEPCLHIGANILKNTDLSYDWLRDSFARDFRLIMSSDNGFSKEFKLEKNLGMSGWILNLTPQDLLSFPKVKMLVESKVVATRGFNEIESPKFTIPLSGGGNWEVMPSSAKDFSVGGKRQVVVKNTQGSCRCLQSVVYKPATGGEFVFAANSSANPLRFSENGVEAWFEIDTTYFEPGQGKLELRAYGNDIQPDTIDLNLYPTSPKITKMDVHKGDNKITIEGERLEQVEMVEVNGRMAKLVNSPSTIQPEQTTQIRTFALQNPQDFIIAKEVSLQMHLNGDRIYIYPERFPVLLSRPTITANPNNEIMGTVGNPSKTSISEFGLSRYPVVPIDTQQMSVTVRSTLTDYLFRAENITIESKIENGQVQESLLPNSTFEVLDPFNLKIGFSFDLANQQYLAGRRLQFRIKDRTRGNSDWYTIQQTFVRTPDIDSVICQGNNCKIIGRGLEYIGQFSTDGGNTWRPTLQIEPASNGRSSMPIPALNNRKLLKIKLRDFPDMGGVSVY